MSSGSDSPRKTTPRAPRPGWDRIGSLRLPPIWLVILATIGAVFLTVVATTDWKRYNDEVGYWLAGSRLLHGQPLYDPGFQTNSPFAYVYPPPMAQVLAPLTAVVSPEIFSALYTGLLLVCLWWLAGRNQLVALALIAYIPVAVELRVRNVHLLLAVLIVLALRRGWAFWIPAAAIKITPVLGGLYLLAAGRWREALKLGVVGLVILGVSYVVSPQAWRDFFDIVGPRAGNSSGAILPIPTWIRFVIGAVLVAAAGLTARIAVAEGRSQRWAEVLLVVALTIANPTLYATAFTLLVAILPLWRTADEPSRKPAVSPA